MTLSRSRRERKKQAIGRRALLGAGLALAAFLPAVPLAAQSPLDPLEDLRNLAPRVFIDCRGCDRDYFRDEITYVNYVRDRTDADVHVLITDQGTGSGGREYTFAFIGLGEFAGIDNTLVGASGPTDTGDEIRRMQVEVLERGLFPMSSGPPWRNASAWISRDGLSRPRSAIPGISGSSASARTPASEAKRVGGPRPWT